MKLLIISIIFALNINIVKANDMKNRMNDFKIEVKKDFINYCIKTLETDNTDFCICITDFLIQELTFNKFYDYIRFEQQARMIEEYKEKIIKNCASKVK